MTTAATARCVGVAVLDDQPQPAVAGVDGQPATSTILFGITGLEAEPVLTQRLRSKHPVATVDHICFISWHVLQDPMYQCDAGFQGHA